MAHFIYLHGFASSPQSRKAVFFSERLRQLGHTVLVPDLEEGDFQGLTITRQLTAVRRVLATLTGPCSLIGSSMGGYVAALAAQQEPRIERLVLMAPAMDMRPRWAVRYGPEQLDLLRYRPVLDNTRLKKQFGYVPAKTSRQAFMAWMRARGMEPFPR